MPFDADLLMTQLVVGVARAMMLFLLSAGLSLIFGVMNVLNFAHATFLLLGGYIIYSVYSLIGPGILMFLLAVAAGCVVLAAIGFALERLVISRMYERELPEQLLLTFSFVLIIGDLIRLVWGVEDRSVSFNIEPLEIFGTFVNPYQFVVIGLGLAVALGLWMFLKFTRYGRIVRAAVHSREMVSALGIRIRLIYASVFALGLALAALAAGAFLPTAPMALGVDIDLIVQSFAVVVIGGFGSILGTFVASLIVGIVYAFSVLVWPNGALAVVFLIVVAILIWRPWGLFGSELRT
ncbi:branched-chain amino acid ABC transporter permease [Bradyrhizobium sp. dw_411]|uniref:branched-chain amino acid ABC transporter permease n=1 Tax=Bradyrhizobium sp. dw_411 TaxID=2720082 RepID=UPI001BCA8772|nr:branched-chain amino acid ABC transporter permease [Bradyrhizobium sp. dw_411]